MFTKGNRRVLRKIKEHQELLKVFYYSLARTDWQDRWTLSPTASMEGNWLINATTESSFENEKILNNINNQYVAANKHINFYNLYSYIL